MKSFVTITILLFTVINIIAQNSQNQNGFHTTITNNMGANSTQARRYEIAKVLYNSHHWQNSSIIQVELFNIRYASGYEKYTLELGYTQGTGSTSPKLKLTDSNGIVHYARVLLGEPIQHSTSYGGHPNKVIPIYVDVKHYSLYKAKITHLRDKVDSFTQHQQIIINESPVGVDIPDFSVSRTIETSSLNISGSNSTYSVNNFVNKIAFTGSGHGALVFKPGDAKELMFGMHDNGNFYWGTGRNATKKDYYSMTLNGSTGQLNTKLIKTDKSVNIANRLNLRTSSSTNNHAVIESIKANGNIYIRSKSGETSSGDLILNDVGGSVGIGTSNTKGFKLGVNGKIAATEVKVALYDNWADYVFTKDYNLKSLQEVENYIKVNGHLPNIPSAKEIKSNKGFELGEMNRKLLEKIEELTLYTIEQEKKLQKVEALELKNKSLEARLVKLENLLKK